MDKQNQGIILLVILFIGVLSLLNLWGSDERIRSKKGECDRNSYNNCYPHEKANEYIYYMIRKQNFWLWSLLLSIIGIFVWFYFSVP